MGMYDTVYVPVELLKAQGDERIKKYANLIDSETTDFQTKDLYNVMATYYLKNVDGKYLLHKDYVESEVVKNDDKKSIFSFYINEISRKCIPELITATFNLFDFYNSDTIDIIIDLKVVVVDGVLTSIECVEYEEQDPKPRIDREKETIKLLRESTAYYKTFRGKLALIVRKVLLSIHKKIYKFNNWLQRIAFKL
jgi:hypothetical protein